MDTISRFYHRFFYSKIERRDDRVVLAIGCNHYALFLQIGYRIDLLLHYLARLFDDLARSYRAWFFKSLDWVMAH